MLMKIKIFKRKHKSNADLTVSALNRSISHSYVRKAKIKTFTLINHIKRFYREYRLPSIASMVFLFLILTLLTVRQLERTSLLALKNDLSEGGDGYSLLLSSDQRNQFSKNDTTENNQTNQSTSRSSSSDSESDQNTSNTFTVIDSSSTTPSSSSGSNTSSSSGSTGSGGTSGGNSGTVPQSDPFSTRIDSFSQGTVSLQCTNTAKPNKGSCSKVYTFSAGIQALNGPGTVSYSWQSNIDSGNGTGSYLAGIGSTTTTINKGITLICTKNSSFTIQFAVLSPVFSNSNTINVNHNCNEI
jgi:hypothetical protein